MGGTGRHSTTRVQGDPAILRALREADELAGTDDEAFLRQFKARYERAGGAATRTRGMLPVRAIDPHGDRSPRGRMLQADPRLLANARELLRRTQGGLRVVGGTKVPPKQFLDCVAVGRDDAWGCTGTLIAPDVVVSAGHCAAFATRVFFGGDVTKAGKISRIKKAVQHPDYRKDGKQNDLLVLLLDAPVTNITPRAIATTAQINKATDARVVGFGNTNPLGSKGYGMKRQVDVPIASPACKGKSNGASDSVTFGCDIGLELVAGKPLLGKDSCTGDSGGPLYIEGPDGEWLLAGATSRAVNSAPNDCGDGGIYVRIDKYRTWIDSVPGVTLP